MDSLEDSYQGIFPLLLFIFNISYFVANSPIFEEIDCFVFYYKLWLLWIVFHKEENKKDSDLKKWTMLDEILFYFFWLFPEGSFLVTGNRAQTENSSVVGLRNRNQTSMRPERQESEGNIIEWREPQRECSKNLGINSLKNVAFAKKKKIYTLKNY